MVCRPGTKASGEFNAMVAQSFNVVLQRGAAAADDASRVVDCHIRTVGVKVERGPVDDEGGLARAARDIRPWVLGSPSP